MPISVVEATLGELKPSFELFILDQWSPIISAHWTHELMNSYKLCDVIKSIFDKYKIMF